jgi:hypothetical protein
MSEDKKIFMSQQVLDALFEQGKAEIDGDTLTINTTHKQVFKLLPAYKFILLAEGDHDPHNLVGKIFTSEQLKKTKADIYMDSCIYKDTPYQIESGFLGIPQEIKPEKAPEVAAEKQKEIEQILQSDKPTEAEDFKIKDLEDYLLKIL